jgi:putative spermidine/putrescine transport system substrate-binding protein
MSSNSIGRRDFLHGVAATGALAGVSSGFSRPAAAKESLTVVDWGPPYIDGSKAAAAKFDKYDINWELHSGGGATILAKIKATWPNSPYDVVDNFTLVFHAMAKEGWAEPVSVETVPNLADVPEHLITKDDKGNWVNIPRNINGNFFAYRTDRCPIEIKSVDDLFNPKLKGQINWPSAVMQSNLQVVLLALARGGDERNMEPGWKALEELAKTGNIGRVYQTTTEILNSMTSGETSVTFATQGTLAAAGKNVPVKPVTKTDPSMKAFILTEGWIIMANSTKKKEAMEFANFMISPESTELFLNYVGGAAANRKVKPKPGMEHLTFTDEEFKKYAYVPDFPYISTQLDGWVKRFEKDIMPLI